MACKVVQDDAIQEGISEDQLIQLKSRKRGGHKADSEYDKWVNVYKILFPEEIPIPSPCE